MSDFSIRGYSDPNLRANGGNNGDKIPDKQSAAKVFSLAAVFEENVRKILDEHYGDGSKLAAELARAKAADNAFANVKLGYYGDIGDISGTQAFADYRHKVMADFPEVRDVRASKDGQRIWATFYLKEPTLLRRIGAVLDR